MRDGTIVLEGLQVTSGYGGVTVLKGLDFAIGHEIFAILGANGAGKSTLMKTIARLLPLKAGALRFRGEDVSASRPYHVAQRGLGLHLECQFYERRVVGG